ncbi:hypothetical protein DPMN_117775 [Dreissena polymorpha]|uniref:Uncharacterized protein n=1 Tax=Dreissena polymorpha TaxID=45954 RepID=A0A9D4JQI8_DREPO|nr:hypothetical protein DPMN_117775 [Dreissena polymorpha]
MLSSPVFLRNFSPRWKEAGPPPFKIKPVKGAVHAVLSRAFVEFALHNEKAVEFYNWTTQTKIPDKTFFATLNHNPSLGAPGAYTGWFVVIRISHVEV